MTNVAIRVANGKYRHILQTENTDDDDLLMEIHPTSVLVNICPEYVLWTGEVL